MPTSLSLLFQRAAPKLWLTRCAGRLASCRQAWVAQPLIRSYARWYGIDLNEALHPDPKSYDSFNAFFTRALRPGARKQADADWTSPADGTISQFGRISLGQLIQAKQRQYSAAALLADADLARALGGGWFTTIYLSPRDYHSGAHALRGTSAGHALRAGDAVLRPARDRAGHEGPAGAQRTAGLLVRASPIWRLCHGAGRGRHRRQHRHGLAWPGGSAWVAHTAVGL